MISFKVCKRCGVPEMMGRNHRWTNDGRIMTRLGNIRGIIVSRNMIDGVFTELKKMYGNVISDITRECKSLDALRYLESISRGPIRHLRHLPYIKSLIYKYFEDYTRIIGMAKLEGFQPSKSGEVSSVVTQCYNDDLFAGDAAAGFMYIEGIEATASFEIRNNKKVIVCRPGRIEHRIDPKEIIKHSLQEPVEGYFSFMRCETCGVPIDLTFLSWDYENGYIYDSRTADKVMYIDVEGVNTVLTYIEGKYGPGTDIEIAKIAKRLSDENLSAVRIDFTRSSEKIKKFFPMAIQGMANPVFCDEKPEGLTVQLENPFNNPLVAGLAASIMSEGRACEFSWKVPAPGTLRITLED